MRRTKIVATLGPATSDPEAMQDLLSAGVNVVRVNFSHGEADDHRRSVDMVRKTAAKLGHVVGILGDLQGPKIRVANFKDGSVDLDIGQLFIIDIDLDEDAGTKDTVGCVYQELPGDLSIGSVLVLDDGRIILEVTRIEGNKIYTTVRVGGKLSNRKGINLRGGGLSAPAITEKDREDLKLAVELKIDYLGVSFPRDAADIDHARKLLNEAGSEAGIVAKIERAEAVSAIDEILEATDVIMVARGDLGVEIGDPQLPAVQNFGRIDESIAMATMYTANHLDVKAIGALTETGSTALWMSRISSGIPIYALTTNADTQTRVTLYRGHIKMRR